MAQPHKGPRKQISSTRVHPDVFDRVEQEAQRLGVHKSDMIAHVMCQYFGMEQYSPVRELVHQDQMQMTA